MNPPRGGALPKVLPSTERPTDSLLIIDADSFLLSELELRNLRDELDARLVAIGSARLADALAEEEPSAEVLDSEALPPWTDHPAGLDPLDSVGNPHAEVEAGRNAAAVADLRSRLVLVEARLDALAEAAGVPTYLGSPGRSPGRS